MYIVDTEIQVNYLLANTNGVVLHTDFDIRINKPNGETVFLDTPILEENFIAPTDVTTGAVSHFFTPDMEGVWNVVLTKGTAPAYTIYYEYFLRVSTPDTHVHQQVNLG